MIISRYRPQAVVALVVAFAVAAFFGLATVSATNSEAATIYACKKKKNGDLRIVKKSKRCKRGEVKTKWNSKGAAGPQGPAGSIGAPASTYLPVQVVDRVEIDPSVCTSNGDVSASDYTCSSAVTAASTKVLFQSPYATVKGSCFGVADQKRTTAQITVQTTASNQSDLFISFFTPGLAANPNASQLTSSSRALRVDNRLATIVGPNSLWGNFTQLTAVDGRNVDAIHSFTTTIVPFVSGNGICRFIGHVTASS